MALEKTKDFEIREALRKLPYIGKLRSEDEGTLVVEEFTLTAGETRIDFAVFNGSFHGFEIKSDKDTLDRLPHQAEYYSKVFEYLYIVVGKKYVDKITSILPTYWGIWIAEKENGVTTLRLNRKSAQNPQQDPLAIAQMLWKDEALGLLQKHNLLKGYKSKPCRILWSRLAAELTMPILEMEVRQAIKARKDWRAALKQKRCDAKSRPSATSSRYLGPLPL